MASPSEKAEKLRDFAAKGNLEGVESMVRDSLDDIIWWINEGNNRGTTSLQLAAMWGHLDVCRALLAAGADKDKQSNVGYSPLICAALKGQAEVVRDMIKLGADKDLVDNDQWTALHHASAGGDVAVVRALLESGASRSRKNADGKTAWEVAKLAGKDTVVTLFRQWSLFEGDSDEES